MDSLREGIKEILRSSLGNRKKNNVQVEVDVQMDGEKKEKEKGMWR